MCKARLLPLLHKLERGGADEDVPDVEGGREAGGRLEPVVRVAVGRDEMVRGRENLRLGELAEVRERVTQDEGVGVDGEAVDA